MNVGELTAYIRADTSGLDKGVDESKGRLSSLGSVAKSVAQGAATAFVGVVGATTALGASALRTGLDYNRLQQSSRAALATLLGGAEAANEQMDKLDAFAKTSPFAKQVFITAQQQLLGFGVEARRVIPILDAVQNAVAAVGGGNEEVSQVTYALAQMQGQGKLTGETLNQLGQYGIDAAGILGKAIGKTGGEIRELASKPGGIPVDQVWDPLVNGLTERFGGATAGIKQQFDGAFDRIKGAWRDIGATFARPLIDPKGGGLAVGWANQFADALRAVETKAKPMVDILERRAQPVIQGVTDALTRGKSAINGFDVTSINRGIDTLVQYAPLVAGLGGAFATLGLRGIPVVGGLLAGVNPLVGGLIALAATSPEVRDLGGALVNVLGSAAPTLATLATEVADLAMYVLEQLVPGLTDLVESAGPAAVDLFLALAPALVAALEAGMPLVDMLASAASAASDLPTPVLMAVAAFAGFKALGLDGVLGGIPTVASRIGQAFSDAAVGTRIAALRAGEVKLAFSGISGVARNMGSALLSAVGGPVGIAIGALSLAVGAYASSVADARARTDSYKTALNDLEDAAGAVNDVMNDALSKDRRGFIENLFGRDPYSLITIGEDIGVTVQDLQGYIEGQEDAVRRVTEAMDAYTSSVTYGSGEWEAATNMVGILRDGLDAERESLELAGFETRNKAAADEAGGEASMKHKEALDALNEEVRTNAELNLSAAEAALRARDSDIAATDAINAMKAAQEEATRINQDANATEEEKTAATQRAEAATRAAENAILSNVRAQLTSIEAMRKNGATNQELIVAVMAARQSFINQQVAMGATREEANRLADEYGLIPSSVITTISAEDRVSGTVRYVQQQLDLLDGRRVNVTVQYNAAGEQITGVGYNSRLSENGSLSEKGNTLKAFANGGMTGGGQYVPRVPQIARGGSNVLWAEDSTVWEGYISGKPSMRSRNLRILDEVARRLGRATVPLQDGGVMSGTMQHVTNTRSARVEVLVSADGAVARDAAEHQARVLERRLGDLIAAGGLETV